MLCNLYVKDFAIVDNLELDFKSGMTTITGETGAGKSISIDALGLCLGNRADAGMVRSGADKTEICASFNLADIPKAQDWLKEQDLNTEDSKECIVRRIVSKEGRSRAYINGAPVPAQQLKSLANYLVNIHGQHAHQLLLKPEYQIQLLDEFAGHNSLVESTHNTFQFWSMLKNQLKKQKDQEASRQDRLQLIQYQVAELDEFNLQAGEFEQIEEEHKRLSNMSSLLTESQVSLTMLYEGDEHSAFGLVQGITNKLSNLTELDENLNNIVTILSDASIQLQEASHELRGYVDKLEPDPQRLQEIENRMSTALELSRKHRVQPELLHETHQTLSAELKAIKSSGERAEQLEQEVHLAEQRYWQESKLLTASREEAAVRLSKHITSSMQQLNMAQGVFKVDLQVLDKPSKSGSDQIEFMVSANPGQPIQAIGKVASGGELSRISLAIQVITAEKISTPTLIFDEVDVGISGSTAAVVGQMLRKIGESTQIICVTHLPQVAASGHQQMQVSKSNDGQSTQTQMKILTEKQRVEELARLLGGDVITKTTLANAKELLVIE